MNTSQSNIHPVILSGGSGSRLWPLSRQEYPKHLIDLIGDRSLVQQTVQRLTGLTDEQPLLVCNHQHRFLIAEEMQDLGVQPQSIILEPCARNTAPAIAIAALALQADDLMLVLPADHLIQNNEAFIQAIQSAVALAEAGHLVTFGITPTSAHTGYGYIQRGESCSDGFQVQSFVEKPDAATAEQYLQQGGYDWNAGLFLFKASVYLEALEQFEPAMLVACRQAYDNAVSDLDFTRLDEKSFAQCADISVDYAVMERTDKGVVVPMQAHWSDVGSWDSLYAVSDKDIDGNVLIGDVLTDQVTNSYIRGKHHLIAAVGLDKHLIVDTPDAVLVAPIEQSQQVKKIVEQLKLTGRTEPFHHQKQYRPWGSHELLVEGEGFQVRRVSIKAGGLITKQLHHKRSEHWVVVNGLAEVVCGDETEHLNNNQSYYVPQGVVHSIRNIGETELQFIEVQVGQCLKDDEDIERCPE